MSRKARISLFCLLNLVTILWANWPVGLSEWGNAALPRLTTLEGVQCANSGKWLLGRYGHFTGLGTNWKLFAGLPRYHYWLTAEITYDDQTVEERPRPRPRHRWPALAPIFDHRENKYDLNLLSNDLTRITFGRWFCREIRREGRTPETVAFVLNRYDIVPRDQLESFVGPPLHAQQRWERISCAMLPEEDA